MSNNFVTVINCMDGRVQKPVMEYMLSAYTADYVDVITEAGPNKILAENKDKAAIESIRGKVSISVQKHQSNVVAIVGHYDCAGNPAGEEIQKQHIRSAIECIKVWGFAVSVIGLWVSEEWKVEEIK